MKRLFNIIAALALLTGFTACEEGAEQTPDADFVVKLTASKGEIVADGSDATTFEVTVDGVVTTEGVQIILLNDNSILEGMTFATTTPGEYRFKAAYKTFTSDTITVKATSAVKSVELIADKSEIVNDGSDAVTFTVMVDGEEKTSEATILDANNQELQGNTFTSTTEGEYSFVAKYEDTLSNTVAITVKSNSAAQKSLTLAASKLRIACDGVDSTTLTVMYGDEDVTTTCALYDAAGNSIETDNGVFTSTTVGTYNIYAIYNNKRSNTVSIDVYDPETTGNYEIGTIYEVGGVKGVIYAIKTDNHNDTYCYLFSMDEADLQWSTENVWCNCGSQRGDWNTEDMLRLGTSPDKYPAAQWCVAHGEGWFMPSSTELQWMWDAISNGTHNFDNASVAQYNKLLTDNGGMPFVETYYMSSNETADDMIELIAFMEDSVICLEPLKSSKFSVRAAYRFKIE